MPREELQPGVSSLNNHQSFPCSNPNLKQMLPIPTSTEQKTARVVHLHFPTQFKASAPIPTRTFPLWSSNLPGWWPQQRKRVKKNIQILSKPVRYDLNRGKSWSGGDAVHCSSSLLLTTSKGSLGFVVFKSWEGTFTEHEWDRRNYFMPRLRFFCQHFFILKKIPRHRTPRGYFFRNLLLQKEKLSTFPAHYCQFWHHKLWQLHSTWPGLFVT